MGHDGDLPYFHARMKMRNSDNVGVIFLFTFAMRSNSSYWYLRLLFNNAIPILINSLFFKQASQIQENVEIEISD